MHDPLTVDHAAEAARPGGVDDRRRDRAAIEGRDVAADQHPVIGDDDAGGRIELTEAAKHPVGTLRLVVPRAPHRAEQLLGAPDPPLALDALVTFHATEPARVRTAFQIAPSFLGANPFAR